MDALIDGIRVLAVCTNQSLPAKEPANEPVKRILRRPIEKEKKYATLRNVRFGEWEPMRENPVPSSSIATPLAALETAMLDADTATAKKSVQKKKHPRVVHILKQSVQATTIAKRILDLGINFTVDKLSASALAFEKQLTNIIFKEEAVQFRVNTLSSAEAL